MATKRKTPMKVRLSGNDPYFRETLDGRYRIAKVVVNGKDRYEVWRKAAGTSWHMLKANMPEYQEALDYLMLQETQ